MGKPEDFIIEDGVLVDYIGTDKAAVIPDGVEVIARMAFNPYAGIDESEYPGPNDIFGITSVYIPASVKKIESTAFGLCTFIETVRAESFEAWCEIDFVNAFSNPMNRARDFRIGDEPCKNIRLKDTVTQIKNYTFMNIDSITGVILPDALTSIGIDAFLFCRHITSLEIPPSVTYIGDRAFCGTGISEITIPESVKKIGKKVFAYCSWLKTVYLNSRDLKFNPAVFDSCCADIIAPHIPLSAFKADIKFQLVCGFFKAMAENIEYDEDVMLEYKKYIKHKRRYFMQSSLVSNKYFWHYYTEEKLIKEEEFEKLFSLARDNEIKAMLIDYKNRNFASDYKEKLEKRAMRLRKQVIETGIMPVSEARKNWKYETYGDEVVLTEYTGCVEQLFVPAFVGKRKVREIGVRAISASVDKSVYEDIIFESEAKGDSCLTDSLETAQELMAGTGRNSQKGARCSAIKSVVISEGITKLGKEMMKECRGVEHIIIASSVIKIGASCFEKCKSLRSVRWSENCERIPNGAFGFCSSLEELEIPYGVTSIGSNAFSDCENLRKIVIPESVESISPDAFTKSKKVVIYAKKDSFAEAFAYVNSIKSVII